MALVLGRKEGQAVKIADNIFVTVVRVGPHSVRLGITAPRDMSIVRSELIEDLGDGDGDEDGEAEGLDLAEE